MCTAAPPSRCSPSPATGGAGATPPPIPTTSQHADCADYNGDLHGFADSPVQIGASPRGYSLALHGAIRHLSNTQSPLDAPTFAASAVTNTQTTLHAGASPSTPGTSWATTFYTYFWDETCPCSRMISPAQGQNPTATVTLTPTEARPFNEYFTWSWNSAVGDVSEDAPSRVSVIAANFPAGAPHIAAWFRQFEGSEAVLEFRDSRYSFYVVWRGRTNGNGIWEEYLHDYGIGIATHGPLGWQYRVLGWIEATQQWSAPSERLPLPPPS